MSSHRIRLAGPWQYEWLGPSEALPAGTSPAGRVKMPAPWIRLFGTAAGRARLRRRFHRPTNLDEEERVFLAFESVAGTGTVDLDEHRLGMLESPPSTAAFDVTALLGPWNELIVELEFDPTIDETATARIWDAVALEIRRG